MENKLHNFLYGPFILDKNVWGLKQIAFNESYKSKSYLFSLKWKSSNMWVSNVRFCIIERMGFQWVEETFDRNFIQASAPILHREMGGDGP